MLDRISNYINDNDYKFTFFEDILFLLGILLNILLSNIIIDTMNVHKLCCG